MASEHEELGRELMERMRLPDVARGKSVGFWRSYAADRLCMLSVVALAILGYHGWRESGAGWWMPFIFVPLAVLVWIPLRRQNPEARVDALVDLLVRTGRITLADSLGAPEN